jgi:nucleoid-associated protein YgaU
MFKKKGWPRSSYLFLAVCVAAFLLWRAGRWPFGAGRSIPGHMPTVAEAARQAYDALSADFRTKVSESDFASMFQRMADPADGAPHIQRASVTDAIGPERARARFRVEYPDAKAKAEYHFERLDDAWQLQSFTRVTGQDRVSAPAEAEPGSDSGSDSAAGGSEAKPAPAPHPTPATKPAEPQVAAARAARSHVIQAGDTLQTLSRKYYGSIRYWRLILEANPGLDPQHLRIGRKIVIPNAPEDAPKAADEPPGP